MKLILVVIGLIALVVAIVLVIKSRIAPTYSVTFDDMPRVLAALSESRETPAFAAFMIATPEQPDEADNANLQFSVEDGKVGFDWVLIAPCNIKDEARFVALAEAHGYAPEMKEMNGVRYLRVESGDLTELFREIITNMYRRPLAQPIDMIIEGFEWSARK